MLAYQVYKNAPLNDGTEGLRFRRAIKVNNTELLVLAEPTVSVSQRMCVTVSTFFKRVCITFILDAEVCILNTVKTVRLSASFVTLQGDAMYDVVVRELRENQVYTFTGVHIPDTEDDLIEWLEDEFSGCEILGYTETQQ